MRKSILNISRIDKKFGYVTALSDFSIDIFESEFITILGPSGCGKTTLLRIIAGLETPDSGTVILNGKDLTSVPPEKRDINTVFQNYALFPHMNVFENVAYGLKLKKLPKKEIIRLVTDMLELVKLSGFEKRKINELSGGQKQRVAIARALVLKPKVLLLDEPLGALDYKLRVSMQSELKKMQKLLNITFIYITHDQDEALNLSDRIVLMNNGAIQQIGTPDDIYNRPENLFVAQFVGEPNIIKGDFNGELADFELCKVEHKTADNENIFAVIRPENIHISENGIAAIVSEQKLNGGVTKTSVVTKGGNKINISSFEQKNYAPGDSVLISCNPDNIHYIITSENIINEKI